jgi:hypothetical protein
MTSAFGPFLTIRAGGPLAGVVTVSAVAEEKGSRLVVEAAWTSDGDRRSASATFSGYDAARTLAYEWADQLAAGREPSS